MTIPPITTITWEGNSIPAFGRIIRVGVGLCSIISVGIGVLVGIRVGNLPLSEGFGETKGVGEMVEVKMGAEVGISEGFGETKGVGVVMGEE